MSTILPFWPHTIFAVFEPLSLYVWWNCTMHLHLLLGSFWNWLLYCKSVWVAICMARPWVSRCGTVSQLFHPVAFVTWCPNTMSPAGQYVSCRNACRNCNPVFHFGTKGCPKLYGQPSDRRPWPFVRNLLGVGLVRAYWCDTMEHCCMGKYRSYKLPLCLSCRLFPRFLRSCKRNANTEREMGEMRLRILFSQSKS